ncbi:hypothetical protein ACFL1T_01830 [Chlamydiota bacterium]
MKRKTGLNKKVSSIFKDVPEIQSVSEINQPKTAVGIQEVVAPPVSLKKSANVFHMSDFLSKNSIGIHISYDFVKIIHIQVQKGKNSIKGVFESALSQDNYYKSLSTTIRRLIHHIGITPHLEVNVTIEHTDINMYYLTIPQVQGKKIHETIMWELSKVSTTPLEDIVMEHSIIEGSSFKDSQLKIVCVVAPREIINNTAQALENIGLVIKSLMPVPCAVENLINAISTINKNDHSIFLNINDKLSTICFFNGTTLHYSRKILIGKNNFIESLKTPIKIENALVTLTDTIADDVVSQVGIPLDEKDTYHSEEYTIPYHNLLSLIRPILEKFISEIQLSTNHYKSHYNAKSFQNFFIAGEMASTNNFDKIIIKTLGMAPEIINPFTIISTVAPDKLPFLDQKKIPTYAVLSGTCLRPKRILNLIPKEIKLNRNIKKFLTSLNILLLGSIILMVGAYFSLKIYLQQTEATLGTIQSDIAPLISIEKKIYEYHIFKNQNSKKSKILTQLKGSSIRWDNVLIELSKIAPQEISITELLNPSSNKLIINGEHANKPNSIAISQFLVNLKNSELFNRVKLISSEKKHIKGNTWSILYKITCDLSTGFKEN